MKLPVCILSFPGFALLTFLLCGCSPFYVLRAAYEEGRILASRKPIEKVVELPSTSPAEKEKLLLVPQAREFAARIGLNPGNSFTKFARVNRDVLAWVLMASKPDAFALRTWWFPIAGTMPYKGFFEKEDALEAARRLEAEGLETYLRPTDAFSTLGWFNDPILSTTLRYDETRIVEIVIHESLHSTVWIGGAVDFNESLANFVGTRATVDFFESRSTTNQDEATRRKNESLTARARHGLERELKMEQLVNLLYNDLDNLYKSDKPSEAKIAERKLVFERNMKGFLSANPGLQIFRDVNNAEIMQLKVYLTGFSDFDRLFAKSATGWPGFLADVKSIKNEVEKDGEKSPWEVLRDRL